MRTAIMVSLLLACLFVSAQDNETGRVFVKSEPAGAAIFLGVKDENGTAVPKDTGKKTNALIEMPVGKQVIILQLAGYEDAVVEVVVDPLAISKPDVVVMGKPTKSVDVLFAEDGWAVSIDGRPALDAKGKPATIPCTIKMAIGKHGIVLTKDGFKDIPFGCDVTDKMDNIEVKGKIEQEIRKSVQAKKNTVEPDLTGTWNITYAGGAHRTYVINKQKVEFLEEKRSCELTKETKSELLLLDFSDGKLERLHLKDKKLLIEHWDPKSKYPTAKPNLTATGTINRATDPF